jgi:hypothetical protein
MTNFEWFLLIVVVIVVPLIVAIVVTLWTIDQANKRKRQNRADAQIGVKRQAALSAEEVAERKAQRAAMQADESGGTADIPAPDGAVAPQGDVSRETPAMADDSRTG